MKDYTEEVEKLKAQMSEKEWMSFVKAFKKKFNENLKEFQTLEETDFGFRLKTDVEGCWLKVTRSEIKKMLDSHSLLDKRANRS